MPRQVWDEGAVFRRKNWLVLFFTVDLGFALSMAGDWGNTGTTKCPHSHYTSSIANDLAKRRDFQGRSQAPFPRPPLCDAQPSPLAPRL
jgi:hypothetical protein